VLLVDSNIPAECRRMPRGPKPIVAKPPGPRDPSVPERLWNVPKRIERACNDPQRTEPLFQGTLAKAAGMSQGTISKLMSYETITRLPVSTLIKLEEGLGVPPGWLLLPEPAVPLELSGGRLDAARRAGHEGDAQKLLQNGAVRRRKSKIK